MICSLPLVLKLPQEVRTGMQLRDKGGLPQWPPYFAPVLNLKLKQLVAEDKMIYSDQPWAVAWYADRISMWLPRELRDFEEIESSAATLDSAPVGILITPSSYNSCGLYELRDKYQEFTSLVMDGPAIMAVMPGDGRLAENDRKIGEVLKRFPYRLRIMEFFMTFYSDRPVKTAE